MANIITAGNSTNGGTSVTTDTSGTLNIVTGSGSGSNAITIDASQNVAVTGNLTLTGNASGIIKSATAVASTSGTSIDFTGIPSTAKRITVMFQGVSTSGTSVILLQIGAGSVTTSGYLGTASINSSVTLTAAYTTGFGISQQIAATDIQHGTYVLTNLNGNSWVCNVSMADATRPATSQGGGSITLGGTLDRIRITTVNGTDTFDAGSVNILWE